VVESAGGDTWVRMRGRRRVRDVRTFGELVEVLSLYGFVRIHRGLAVNVLRVREIRPATDGGWEVRLDPPVNRVLPVSRRQRSDLFAAFGERDPGD
jgi:DNA-binding LytR/AlgR family response regulator